jgi:hypothetical protein
LLAAAVLGAVLIPIRSPGAERLSIEELLKAEQRRTIIHGLESWSEELSADQIELLEDGVREWERRLSEIRLKLRGAKYSRLD